MKKLIFIFIFLPFVFNAQGIVVGDTTSSNITYKNIRDTVIIGLPWFSIQCDIDIDGDSFNDITFYCQRQSSPGFSSEGRRVASLSNIEIAIIPPSNGSTADTLSKDSIIDNGLIWKPASSGSSLLSYYWSSGLNYTSSGLFFGNNLYLGFRKIYALDTIYGWFLIDMFPGYKIKAFAYEKKDVGIHGLDVRTSNFSIYPNPASEQLYIKNTGSNKIKECRFSALDGRSLELVKLEEGVYDVSTFPAGIYILQLKFDNFVLNKKIVIQH